MPNRLQRRAPRPRRPQGPRGQALSDSMSGYYPPPTRRRNRTAEILTTSFLVTLLVLLGVGLMLWALETRIAFAPTPTATATARPPQTSTPDFRATRVVEEILTQQAYQVALIATPQVTPELGALDPGDLTPSEPGAPETATGELPVVELTPRPATDDPMLTPSTTANIIVLPIVAPNAPVTASPTAEVDEAVAPIPDSPLPTPTLNQITLPNLSVGGSVTPPPTATQTVVSQETPTATLVQPSPTSGPTDTPTPEPPTSTPTPTTSLYRVNSLRAFVRENGATMHIGPSAIYTQTGTLTNGEDVTLYGRNETGEWVLACCAAVTSDGSTRDETGWIRQANVRPTENALDINLPEDSDIDPNDVQWLPIQQGPTRIRPLVTTTPIPPEDYPHYQYGLDNDARVPDLPNPPVISAWPAIAQAGQTLLSPVAVSGASVLVTSADNHIYSFDRTNGNQRWRFNLGQQVRLAPAIYERTIYIVDITGRVTALEDQGNAANQLWTTTLPQPAVANFSVLSDTIFINAGTVGGAEPQYVLHSLERTNGNIRDSRNAPVPGTLAGRPALSDQLMFIAADGVVALDYRTYGVVWRRDDLTGITTAPLYSFPGVNKLAELFVVDGGNRIYSLNANTGAEYWNFDNGELATDLAANSTTLFVSGDGYVKAIRRVDRVEIWRTTVGGSIMGGPLVDNEQVLVLTQSGLLQFLDANTGALIGGGGVSIAAAAAGAPAVSPPWIFAPGVDGRLYALRQAQ